MLTDLPLEIQVYLLKLSPESSLKAVNFHFYLLYNELFHDKLIGTFGDDVKSILAKVYPWLRIYIMSLDAFRYVSRNILARRLRLTDFFPEQKQMFIISRATYVSDSWKYIYSLLKNKRLFAEYTDYSIDEPHNYIYDHFVEINRTYLLSYTKTIWLAPGCYNLNIALAIKEGQGLGTTKFEVKYSTHDGEQTIQTFYPPSNINEILPKKKFCFLKVGEFRIPSAPQQKREHTKQQSLCKVQLTMEEIGLFVKSGFRIYFIDISQHSMLFNDYDLLFYSCEELDYRYFINLPLKNFYKVLNEVQNWNFADLDEETKADLDASDNREIVLGLPLPTCSEEEETDLMKYANYYFLNTFRRNFRFNTVYQKRQFINRFGNYEADLQTGNDDCAYDPTGLKWKIPIVGEL